MNTLPLRALATVFAVLTCTAFSCTAQSIFVTTPADSGAGSLRAAIVAANGNPDRSTIDFAIDPMMSGPGPWTINLASELPELNTPVLIRGYSQPGARSATTPLDARLMIEIDDSAVPSGVDDHHAILAFVRGAENSVVNGLSLVGTRPGGGSAALLLMANGVRASSNWIGVRANGSVARYGGAAIVAICADGMIIGGSKPADGNLVGGSDLAAVHLTGGNHIVRHNWIGFDRFGASTFGNFINGQGIIGARIGYSPPPRLQNMYAPAVQQAFFGLRDALIADNRISSTRGSAINLTGQPNATSGNSVLRNVLGRDLYAGAAAMIDTGVRLDEGARNNLVADNLIGRANSGIVLGNDRNPVTTYAGEGNELRRNLVFDVADRAIALNPDSHFAPLVDDPLDADSGGNGLQNKPSIDLASTAGGISGSLHAQAMSTYAIDLFLSGSCHPGGFDRAEFLLGAATVTTDGNGNARFDTAATQRPWSGLKPGDVVTASATDIGSGSTSELSACVALQTAPAPVLVLSGLSSPVPAMDPIVQPKVTVQSLGPRTATGEIAFVVETATERRELGRVTISNGQASLPVVASGWLPHAGRYRIHAEYAGDAYNSPARSASETVVVFRPPTALLDPGFSSPVRRNLASGDREFYFTPMQTWRLLATAAGTTYVDADRFNGSLLDRVFVDKAGQFAMVDGAGTMTALYSAQLGNTDVLDLLHLDGDLRVDAVVRERQAARYRVVLCVFMIDNCEKSYPLDVNPEFVFRFSGDFNGDGHADLAFRNPASGELQILTMIGAQVQTASRYRASSSQQAATSADVNGDGYDDLILIDAAARTLEAWLFDAGRPSARATAALSSSTWATPGAVYVGKPGDADHGVAQLVLRDSATGEVVVWRKPTIAGGVLSASPVSLYFDPALTVERTR